MKKISLLISTVVAALSLASCQKEQMGPAGVEGDYATVNIAVHAPGQLVTKAVGDGQTADNLVFAVFDEAGNELIDLRQGDWIKNQTELTFNQTDANGNPMTTVKTTLVRGKEYTFVCWAQNKEAVCYDFTSLKEIGVDYSTYNVAQNEKRDAFYAAVQSGKVTDDFSMSIELRRPFAQINVGTDDIQAAHSAGLQVNNLYATMTVANVATKLHTFVGEKAEDNDGDGKVEGNTNVTFTLAPSISKPTLDDATKVWSPNEEWLTVNHEDYKDQNFGWLAMNYILVNDGDIQGVGSVDGTEPVNTTVSFTVYEGEGLELCSYDVPNVTVQRNYRTHILGSVLTAEGTLNVIIEPAFINDEDHVVEIWDGHTVSEPKKDAQGNYLVTKPEELAWVAKQVNEEGKTFEGVTVYLTSDIDLAGQVWTPIGAGETPFKGTFEVLPSPLTKSAAEYCAIYGLNVNYTEGPAGLFGWLNGTVKNVTLDAPVVKGETCVGAVAGKIFNSGLVDGCQVNGGSVYGNHYVGGVVGYAYGSVTNCVVDGVAVTGAAVQGNEDLDGDKVGGVLGFHPADADGTEVSGNTVLDVNVAAKRDAAAVVGAANADNVKGNHVEKATIGSTEAQISDAGVIVGRVIAGTLNPKANTYNHEQITVNGVKAESAVFEFSAKAASEEVLPVEGGKYVISVTGNVDWTLTLPEGLTSDVEDGKGFGAATITVTVPANEAYEPAEYTVVVKTEAELTEPEAATEYTFTISQVAAERPFEDGAYWIVAVGKYAMPLTSEYGYLQVDPYGYQDNVFTIKAVDGGYTIQDPAGQYYYQTGTYNSFNRSASKPTSGAVWSIKENEDGTCYIMNTSVNKFMQYDATYNSYGSYAELTGEMPALVKADNAKERLEASNWSVIGVNGDWDNDITMYIKDNYFVAYDVEIKTGDFKFRKDKSWDVNFGGEGKTNTAVLAAADGSNITVPAGTYDLYLDVEAHAFWVMTAGQLPTAPDFKLVSIYANTTYTNLYAWSASGAVLTAVWPGSNYEAAEEIGGTSYKKWTLVVDTDTYTKTAQFIFNNGSSQTADSEAYQLAEEMFFAVSGTSAPTLTERPVVELETIEATLTFDDKSKRTTFTNDQQVWQENGITVTNDKNNSTNNVADYCKPARFYKGSGLKVEVDGNISSIEFDCNSATYANDLKTSIGTTATVSVSSDKVTVTLDGVSSFAVDSLNAQIRMDAVTVTYTK